MQRKLKNPTLVHTNGVLLFGSGRTQKKATRKEDKCCITSLCQQQSLNQSCEWRNHSMIPANYLLETFAEYLCNYLTRQDWRIEHLTSLMGCSSKNTWRHIQTRTTSGKNLVKSHHTVLTFIYGLAHFLLCQSIPPHRLILYVILCLWQIAVSSHELTGSVVTSCN